MPPGVSRTTLAHAQFRLVLERYLRSLSHLDTLRFLVPAGERQVIDFLESELYTRVRRSMSAIPMLLSKTVPHRLRNTIDLPKEIACDLHALDQTLRSHIRITAPFPHRPPSRTALDLWRWLTRGHEEQCSPTTFLLESGFDATAPSIEIPGGESRAIPRIVLLPEPHRDDPLSWTSLGHELTHVVFGHVQGWFKATSVGDYLCHEETDEAGVCSEPFAPPRTVQMRSWHEEFLADVYSATRLGPSYFLHLASLALLSESSSPNVPAGTHPPWDMRLWNLYRVLPVGFQKHEVLQEVSRLLGIVIGIDLCNGDSPRAATELPPSLAGVDWPSRLDGIQQVVTIKTDVGDRFTSTVQEIDELCDALSGPVPRTIDSVRRFELKDGTILSPNEYVSRLEALQNRVGSGENVADVSQDFDELLSAFKEEPSSPGCVLTAGWLCKWRILLRNFGQGEFSTLRDFRRRSPDDDCWRRWSTATGIEEVFQQEDFLRVSIQNALIAARLT
jgi:hypothetical protein